jgi:hypothetical protein
MADSMISGKRISGKHVYLRLFERQSLEFLRLLHAVPLPALSVVDWSPSVSEPLQQRWFAARPRMIALHCDWHRFPFRIMVLRSGSDALSKADECLASVAPTDGRSLSGPK